MSIYLFRHAESEGNKQKRLSFLLDSLPTSPLGSHLSEEGHVQAEELALRVAAVAFVRIYASDLWRAQETALAIAQLRNQEIITTPEIRERQFGEGDYAAGQRLKAWLIKTLLHEEGEFAVVSHGAVMRALLADLGLAKVDELPGGTVENTGYAVLTPGGESFVVSSTWGITPRTSSEIS